MFAAKIRLLAFISVTLLFIDLVSLAEEISVTPDEMKLIRAAQQERVEAIKKVYGTVLSVFRDEKKGGGSGVLIDSSGFALTNHHVVAPIGKKGKAGLSSGKVYDWSLVGTDPAGDIAIIQLHGRETWPLAELGDSTLVRQGDWVMAMGNPFGLASDHTPTVTLGIVSGVNRYQGGGMVYGNCIQVDSAINPGNSGGPLMNMRGEVIGINGRAAFAERGRVSVGVGFAVSTQQIRNFIPDLLATKVAQHGTLDAQFGMRDGEVICESINLDSRAARAGLKLGDRLISINGDPISTSNELANKMAMLPTDWPVQICYERDGRTQCFSVRLSALRFANPAPQPVEEEPAPQEKEPTDKSKRKRPGLPKLLPGALLSVDTNRANAKWIIQKWQSTLANKDPKEATAIQWTDTIQVDGREIGKAVCTLTRDGRFQYEHGQSRVYRTVSGYFEQKADSEPQRISIDDALNRPGVLGVAIQAAQFDPSILSELGAPTLDGGDSVDGSRAFRLRFDEQTNDPLYVWVSLSAPHTLLKTGFDIDGTTSRPAVVFCKPTSTKQFRWDRHRKLVKGVRSAVQKEWIAVENEIIEVPDRLRGDNGPN